MVARRELDRMPRFVLDEIDYGRLMSVLNIVVNQRQNAGGSANKLISLCNCIRSQADEARSTAHTTYRQAAKKLQKDGEIEIDDDAQVSISEKGAYVMRSEEHTSELQSPCNLVCRLL